MRVVAWSNTLNRDTHGNIVDVTCLGVDLTERKLTEEALRASKARYAATISAVDDGLWEWDVLSGQAKFSAIHYRMLGCENDEFTSSYESWRQLVHPEDIEGVELALQRSHEFGQGFNIDLGMKTKSGEWKWVCTRGKGIEKDMENKALRSPDSCWPLPADKPSPLKLST